MDSPCEHGIVGFEGCYNDRAAAYGCEKRGGSKTACESTVNKCRDAILGYECKAGEAYNGQGGANEACAPMWEEIGGATKY